MRPLSVEETAEVIAMDPSRDEVFDPDEVLTDPSDVLTICSSLVTITGENIEQTFLGSGNPETGNKHLAQGQVLVTLAHYSVKEYLISDRITKGGLSMYHVRPDVSHLFLARCCLAYLKRFQPSGGVNTTGELASNSQLRVYAARYCYDHCKSSSIDLTQDDLSHILTGRTTIIKKLIQRPVKNTTYLASLVGLDQMIKYLERMPGVDLGRLSAFCYTGLFAMEDVS